MFVPRYSIELGDDAIEPGRPLSVLIIEDDGLLRNAFESLVTDLGHYAFAADSLESADALLEAFIVDVVICDLRLDDGRGERRISRLRGGRSPVLGPDGTNAARAGDDARRFESDSRIAKTISVQDLRTWLYGLN